jgi:hypothetical protein
LINATHRLNFLDTHLLIIKEISMTIHVRLIFAVTFYGHLALALFNLITI